MSAGPDQGEEPSCPANAYRPSDYVCRAADGVCDVAETCSGTSPLCPIDRSAPSGTPCVGPLLYPCDRYTCNSFGSCIRGDNCRTFEQCCASGCEPDGMICDIAIE